MSAKKKKVVTQCTDCGCYFLTKDFDEHAGITTISSPKTASIPQRTTPKSKTSPGTNLNKTGCKKGSSSESRVQMIEAKKGMIAMSHVLDERNSFLLPE
jgi:hypothetical protein